MAKSKVMQSLIASRNGYNLILQNGATVVANLNKDSKIGDNCTYVEMRSLQTVRYQAGSTQWTDRKPTGAKFFKEV